MSFGDGYICHMEWICTIRIKLSDEMVRELKDARYVPQLKNVIWIRALEAQDLRGTLEEGVLKMFRGSLVILKSIRRNNLYYLKGCAVIENLIASEYLDDDSIRL